MAGAVAILHAAPLQALVPVEQIESYEVDGGDDPNNPTRYAPIDFGGSSPVTETSGTFAGITFDALSGLTNTMSYHAADVASSFYGVGSVGNPYVGEVYAQSADDFYNNDVNPQTATSTSGPYPGVAGSPLFPSGVSVVNNSYIADGAGQFSDVDALRRLDLMIATANVTFVTAAVSYVPNNDNITAYYLNWSAFNSLAVSGSQTFDPTGSPGKAHADLGGSDEASFTTAAVSGDALGLYGSAQAAQQYDAEHDIVIRSLLMAGADKGNYTAPYTANHLSVQNGAGAADYANSLAILQAGEQPIVNGGSNTSIYGASVSNSPRGWAYGTIGSGSGNSFVFFHSDTPITGITASLNWDVTQMVNYTNDTIDTTDAGTVFPDVGLEVVPVVDVGSDVLEIGTQADPTLISTLPQDTDNEQYIDFNGVLPAGDYAFELIDDSPANQGGDVGLSYSITTLVPEPASMGLIALEIVGLCVRRRGRNRA